MTSVYAGPYQGDLRDLGGAALVGASVQVRIAGTATPATLYNKSVAVAVAGSGDSLGNPLPAAAGEGLPGIDSGGSVAFFAATLAADGTAAAYDLVVTYGSYVLGPFRVYAAPSPLELAVKLPVFSPGAPAAGSASGKDKAAVQAALAAWTASTRGGTVFFVGGSWDVGDLQLPLSQDLDKPLNYEGEGKSSYFKFSVDKGLGTFAIKGGDTIPSGGSCNSTISNIYFVGPGVSTPVVMGASGCAMDGIRLQGGLAQHNVWYTGWRSAQVNYSDHTYSSWVHANDNYYAEYFPSAPASIGDHVRLHCQYDGNRMGSIGIGPTGQMVSYTFLGGHLGVSPYSIYIEAGAGGGHVSIQSSRFIGTSFEGVGNAHIYSAGKTAWMIGTLFQDVGNWSMYPVSTYNIAANDHAACWYLGEMVDVRIRGGSQNPLGLGSTAAIDCPTIQGLSWEGYKSTLTAAIAASLPVILTDVINAPGIALSDGADRAIAGLCYPSAVSAGQITAAGLNGPYLTPYAGAAANGGGIIQGVALTAGSVVGSGRQAAIVQIEGQVAVNCAVTGVVNNEVLVPDTATPSSVTRAVLSPSSMLKPVIGARVSGDGTGGTVTIKLGIGQRPTITPPTVTGSRGANAALASLLTQLAAAGVIVDSSS